MYKNGRRWRLAAFAAFVSLAMSGCHDAPPATAANNGVTDISITGAVIQSGVKRLGINLGGQNYYDSGQMLRDMTFNNPGFEGETWQSILRCKQVTASSCTDGNQWTQWPADFLQGATYEVISGAAVGATGVVASSTAADQQSQGVTILFAATNRPMNAGDFVMVKKTVPGNAQAGWWSNVGGGGSFETEFKDLAPGTAGKQALKILAAGPEQSAQLSSYFDSVQGKSYVQMNGIYRLSFKAKGLKGNNQLHIDLKRMTPHVPEQFLNKVVSLESRWKDYSFDFNAHEGGREVGTVGLSFYVSGADMLMDDVALTEVSVAPANASGPRAAWYTTTIAPAAKTAAAAVPENTTAFRGAVLDTLKQLHPGILRYQDGDHLGSSIDNMIAPAFGRVRAGFSEGASLANVVPIGLPEFLQLCQVIDAEPWFNLPAGTSPVEAKNLIEYLAGPASTPYGAKRARLGQAAPWTSVFRKIHLELGNEEWNGVTFAGSAMPDPAAFGQRAKLVYAGARSSAYYQPEKFDLVLGSFALIPDWSQKEMASSGGFDSVSVAPYLYDKLDDDTSDEAIFGPMFAQPEMVDSRPGGYMAKQAAMARAAGTALNVYEVNMGTASGAAPQTSFDEAVPSIAAGLTLIDHMLLMLRDLGVKDQSVWELPGYSNGFQNSYDHTNETTPLYGVVLDMGGPTNRRRPQYLAETLANQAMLPNMLETKLTGANPAWNQAHSDNDNVQLDNAHCLQTFAFADGGKRSLVVLNLSRTDELPVTFSGYAPAGKVTVSRMSAENISDSNEKSNDVKTTRTPMSGFDPHVPMSLPPFSMTVLEWTAAQ